MNKVVFLIFIITLFLLAGNSYALFQTNPTAVVRHDDCVLSNSTNVFVLSALNEYYFLGKDASKTIVNITINNSNITEIITMSKGDVADFDIINTGTGTLIDTDSLRLGYDDSAFIFFKSYFSDVSISVVVSMYDSLSMRAYNTSFSIPICSYATNAQMFSKFSKESSEFLGNWSSFWNILSGGLPWNYYVSSAFLESTISVTGTAWSLANSADPGWLDVATAMKSMFSNKVPVIGNYFNILTDTTENLLSKLIISICSWTPETEETISNVKELQQLLLNESADWNASVINYTEIGNYLDTISERIASTNVKYDIDYYDKMQYYQLSSMLHTLDDYLKSLETSLSLRKVEVMKHLTATKHVFNRRLSANVSFNNTKISSIGIFMENRGSVENITTGINKTVCVIDQYGTYHCSKLIKRSFANITIFENNTGIFSSQFDWDQVSGTSYYAVGWFEAGIRFNYTYFVSPNTTAIIVADVPNIEMRANMTAVINITTLDTSNNFKISIQRKLFEASDNGTSLGLGVALPYCASPNKNIRIKLVSGDVVNDYYRKLNQNMSFSLAKGLVRFSIFPDYYLRNSYSLVLNESMNMFYMGFIPGNQDNDDKISKNDLDIVRAAFLNYDALADVNCDSVIDVLDMAIIGKNMYRKSDLEPDQINLSIKMIKLSGLDSLDEGILVSGNYNLSGFTLRDEANHTYVFPNFILNGSVFIHTGTGINNQTDLFWNRSSAVWNNDGDTTILISPANEIIAREYCGAIECWY